jgi:CBS domain-containing protein
MSFDLSETTIYSFPHAFLNRRSEPIMIGVLEEKWQRPLVEMYLAYRPRNSFSGLPPITDPACIQWVEGMIANGVNLTALSFDVGVVGHAAIFPVNEQACELFCAVSHTQHRIGIGTELTRCTIQLAHELSFDEILLNVEAGNHIARHVYEKCGFEYSSRSLVGEVDMRLDLLRYRSSLDAPVREIMKRQVVAVPPDLSCLAVLRIFLEDGIASLPVVDGDGRLIGIISETDLLSEDNIHKLVSDVLTRDVISVQEGYPIAKLIPLFRSRKLRCIPVLNPKMKLVGVVGRRDVLEHYLKRL